ncbi:MAG: SUMF1/EgtB/PvdO family nonheme iron enzyme [Chloroflexi bacterium]|nr:SUMF1/EgtB/PvdO family nonheme iron enzyme [Chloroflexota bacterium]
MSDDLLAEFQSALTLRSLMGEAFFEQALARLREKYSVEAVDALLQTTEPAEERRSHTQVVTGNPAVAIAGNQYGPIFIGGWRSKTNEQLLAGYLQRLIPHCDSLPLQAMRDRSDLDDTLGVRLDQVYTQLATNVAVERERLTDAALAEFDAERFLQEHSDDDRLPLQARIFVRWPGGAADRAELSLAEHSFLAEGGMQRTSAALDRLSAADLANLAGAHAELTFFGPQLVTEAIAAQLRLVLLGEPGSGKSTALRYLALTLARAGLSADDASLQQLTGWEQLGAARRLIPIFLPLLPFAQRLAADPQSAGSAAELWNYIADHLEPQGAERGLAEAVYAELTAGRVLLLLDGLDEVAGGGSRQKVVRAVQQFAHEHSACRIVVSCRVRAYEGDENAEWRLPGWPTATLADWTIAQMRSFVDAWYGAAGARMASAERDRRRRGLRQALDSRADLHRLGVRPLLLTITALVHLNDGELPEDRAGLYSRCVDILLARWESGRVESGYASAFGTLMDYIGLAEADVKSLRPLLQRAAFQAHETGSPGQAGSLSRAVLRDLVAEELEHLKHPNPFSGATRFLDYADQRAGILQARDAGDAYVFPHQTFQEYLAGLHLVNGVDFIAQIMARRTDDRWRVPIMLGIGHLVGEGALAMPFQLLRDLIDTDGQDEQRRQRDLVLAAEIAADVGWPRLERGGAGMKQLRRDLAQRLARVVEGMVLPAAERVRAGKLLGDLGDPRPGVCDVPPAMVELPAREFVIGSTPEEADAARKAFEQYWLSQGNEEVAKYVRTWPRDEINDQPMRIAPFALARYLVTNAQYQLFMQNGGYDPSAPWWDDAARDWLARYDAVTPGLLEWQRREHKDQPEFWDDERFGGARPNHPVVGISWYEATAFCRWLTRYLNDGFEYCLPSEAEWEYAARGTTRRTYAWGNEEPDGERANFNRIYNGTTAVGCLPRGATPEGVYDMTGNIWGWTRSTYRPYPYDPTDGREDGAEPARKRFTFRGGGWYDQSIHLRASVRNSDSPDFHINDVGLRLARRPPRVKR